VTDMQKITVHGLTLFFSADEQDTADLIRPALEKSARLIQDHCGLDIPKDCRIYVMTSWLDFAFRSAPWPWKVLLAVSLPLWAFRARKTWAVAGGWEQRYGSRRAVGVKPARLLQIADRRIGDRFFIKETNIEEKVQSITCHELTHAYMAHLRLPTWLKEGLAMLMVDKFFERPTVQHKTLALLEHSPEKHGPGGRQKLRIEDEEALVRLYTRAYWLTRYIEETQPGLLKDLLSQPSSQVELESRIAAAYEKGLAQFWGEIDGCLLSYFKPE